jgi:RNA polymerase sigma factor (sigma-70 family)
VNHSKVNKRKNKEIHRLSLKIENGITDKELSNLIELVRGQLTYMASKIIKLNDIEMSDFISSVVLKILSNLDKYDPNKGRFTTWANTICINDARRKLKDDQKKIKTISLSELGIDGGYGSNRSIARGIAIMKKNEDLVNIENPESLFIDNEEDNLKKELINKMHNSVIEKDKTKCRIGWSFIFNNIMIGDMKIVDASNTLNIPEMTVRMRCYNLRSKFSSVYSNALKEIYLR